MTAREISLRAHDRDRSEERRDLVAEEEPLEIQIGGASIAVVMRTPGHDEELALGFLATERVVESADDVVSIRHCSTVSEPEAEDNIVRAVLADHVAPPLERLRRNTYASSSCGICGKATIAAALAEQTAVRDSGVRVDPAVLYGMPSTMRAAQAGFAQTGGVHAAGLFDAVGALAVLREDVGRHNAVDKVIGARLFARAPLAGHVLLVSGRVSFEIVQKAAAAGIEIVAGISAPTSLAVRYGKELGVTVIGFLRGETMNVYACAHRVGSLHEGTSSST